MIAAIITALFIGAGEPVPVPEQLERIATAVATSAERWGVPADVLARVGYYESRYRVGAVGDHGRSVGVMQVGARGRRVCACGEGLEAEIDCGACWLAAGLRWCGSVEGALSAYACGACTPVGPRCRAAVGRRM